MKQQSYCARAGCFRIAPALMPMRATSGNLPLSLVSPTGSPTRWGGAVLYPTMCMTYLKHHV